MDLSEFGFPVSAHTSTPENKANGLSATDLAQYAEQGFIAGKDRLSSDVVDGLLEDLAWLMLAGHEGEQFWHEYHANESISDEKVLFHALGAWRISERFHDLLWEPAVTVTACQLLGADVRFWHDQLFCKPPHEGGGVAWHQDFSYWTRTKPMAHLTCWVALEDATVDNGCVHYIPGSHRWDLLPITGLAGDMNAIRETLSERQFEALDNPIPMELKKGEMVFHHPLVVHGSFGNQSNQQRPAAVINMIADGVMSNSNLPLLDGIPVIEKGKQLKGRFFPLLRKLSTAP